MNKITVRFCVLIIAFWLFGQHFAQAQVFKNGEVATESSIKNYVAKANNPRIQYKDGKVLFFADPSNFDIVEFGFLTLLFLGVTYYELSQTTRYDRNMRNVIAAIFGAAGSYTGLKSMKMLMNKLSSIPYIVLDKQGLICNGTRNLAWADIAEVRCIQQLAEFKMAGVNFCLLDKYDNSLFKMTGDNKLLPTQTIAHLLVLISYYRSQALSVPVLSIPIVKGFEMFQKTLGSPSYHRVL